MTFALAGGVYTRRFYLNANLLSTLSGVALYGDSPHNMTLGGAWQDDLRFGHGAGALDEVSIWSKALSAAEIANIYNVTVASEGDTYTITSIGTGPAGTPGALHLGLPGGGNAPAGQVPVADGTGGTVYAAPTVKAYHNGA